MAKKMYIGVDGVARNIKKQYIGVDGVSRKVKKGYIGVDGVARQFYAGDVTLGSLDIGASVFITRSGKLEEYLVIEQGIPKTDTSGHYDDTFKNGTWLMLRYRYDNGARTWSTSGTVTSYKASGKMLDQVLNTAPFSFLLSYSSKIQNAIKTVNIPYNNYKGEIFNDFATKLFPLSVKECNRGDGAGSALSYFLKNTGNEYMKLFISGSSGIGSTYWMRDVVPVSDGSTYTNSVYWWNHTTIDTTSPISGIQVRYAFVMPSEIKVNEDGTLAL